MKKGVGDYIEQSEFARIDTNQLLHTIPLAYIILGP
jgi:hypothetical protein